MLNWLDFKNTCEYLTAAFEDLCRIFFKYRYVKNAMVILNQKANNPGIETEPILVDGKMVGFQAKYFTKNISYTNILDSMRKVVKYYSGKIDKVVLFCNQDIDPNADNYKKAIKLLLDNNIEIELCCNNNILDSINTVEEYAPIKYLFFNKMNLNEEWFKDRLNRSLKELEPRYRPGLHVNEVESQKHFDILYRNDRVVEYLQELIDTAKKVLKDINRYQDDNKIKNQVTILERQVETVLDSLRIPDRHNYEEILCWYEKFSLIEKAIEHIQEPFYKELETTDKWDERRNIYAKLSPFNQLKDMIQRFNLAENEHLRYINNRVLIVEGDAGKGKSHLLGYEAEYHSVSEKYRSVLLLGQKFIFDKPPQEQIMQILGLKSTFQEFLLACEAKGEIDGGITVIMIDAVNECKKYSIWKQYLNEIIEDVKKLKFVRLVCSIRTTYKKYIFTAQIMDDIEEGSISFLEVTGFRNNLAEAIPLFFNYYNIPITTSAFFEFEFENPLFLQTYCEAYSEGIGIGSRGIFALYNAYIEKEEEKVRTLCEITNDIPYAKKIIGVVGKYLFNNNTNYIILSELYSSCKDIPECNKFIDAFLKAKVLVQYNHDEDEEEYIYLNYERFTDYIVAKHILGKTNSFDELCSWIKQELFKTDKYGRLIRRYVEGRFAALSLLAREKYNKEIIDCLDVLSATDKSDNYLYSEIVTEYLDTYLYRADSDINADDFYKTVVPHIKYNRSTKKYLDILIGLSGRNCSLNINNTTKILMRMSLKNRDYHWTCYINDRYMHGEMIYNIVQYFLNADLFRVTHKDRLVFGQLLTWFLSSSNRELRDKSSRSLIRLIKNDVAVMTELLSIFSGVNDPYIISRLYGCIYGALLQTEDGRLKPDKLSTLCKNIFNDIFDKEIVYTDILLRDYALNIIEFCHDRKVQLDFEIDKCRPPYKSFEIPKVGIEKLKELYPEGENNYRLGTYAIRSSMAPNINMEGFSGFLYGDFGRYTFQSALNEFKSVDIERAFCYAYSYIINILGYDNKLFSEYDSHIGHGRGRTNCYIERIGKKYEWIAMYHVLALVADHHEFDNEGYNKPIDYKGAWRPYLRDFDPTLTITNDDHPYKNWGIALNRIKYTNWQLSNDDWAKTDDVKDFQNQVRMVDNNGEVWYALYFSASDASGKDFDKARQSVWLSATACLIKKSECQNFISKIKDKSFYGRWFRPAEVESRYNVFAREYVWSPAYKDEYCEDGFIGAEIETGKRMVVKSMPVIKYGGKNLTDLSDDDITKTEFHELEMQIIEEKKEVEEPIKEVIGSLLPCYHAYLWEEEYDYSKEAVIHISMPNGLIVNALNIKQTLDGVWQRDDDVVCADFSLIQGSNIDGLYIKEKYLRELLNQDYSMVWIGLGEKQHTFGMPGVGGQFWSEISSLLFENEVGDLEEIFISNHRGSKN